MRLGAVSTCQQIQVWGKIKNREHMCSFCDAFMLQSDSAENPKGARALSLKDALLKESNSLTDEKNRPKVIAKTIIEKGGGPAGEALAFGLGKTPLLKTEDLKNVSEKDLTSLGIVGEDGHISLDGGNLYAVASCARDEAANQKFDQSIVNELINLNEIQKAFATQDLNEQVRSEVETQMKGFEEAIKAQNPKEISEFIETFKKDQEEKKAALERAKRDAAWNSVGNVASAVGHSFSAVQSFLSNKDIAKAQSKQGVKANRLKPGVLEDIFHREQQSDPRTIFFNNLQHFEEAIKSGDEALEQIEILLGVVLNM